MVNRFQNLSDPCNLPCSYVPHQCNSSETCFLISTVKIWKIITRKLSSKHNSYLATSKFPGLHFHRTFKNVYLFFFFFFILGPHMQHMEVPRLGVKSKLQLLAYTKAAATQDPSCICDLPHSSRQCQILKPLGEARN